MRQAPGRVERLALLDTSARPDTPESRQDRERLIALAEAGRFDSIISTVWPRLVHPMRQPDQDLKAVVADMMGEVGAQAYAASSAPL